MNRSPSLFSKKQRKASRFYNFSIKPLVKSTHDSRRNHALGAKTMDMNLPSLMKKIMKPSGRGR